MITRRACAALILASLLAATAPARARAGTASPSPSVRVVDQDAGGLVVLAGGRAVLWNGNGQLQLRSAAGAWSPPIALALAVEQVLPDGAGMLLSAIRHSSDGVAHPVILRLHADGGIADRWQLDSLRDIGVAADRRWATAFASQARAEINDPAITDLERQSRPLVDRLLELVSGGTLEERGFIEMDARLAAFDGGASHGLRVDCVPPNLSAARSRPAYCVAVGAGGWRRVGLWNRPPVPCGRYLIEINDRPGARRPDRPAPGDARSRDEGPQVTVRRLADGGVAGRRPLQSGQTVVCGGPGELLVGRDDAQGWSLPELKTVWRARTRGRVTALARIGDQVLAATAAGAMITLRRPAIAAP